MLGNFFKALTGYWLWQQQRWLGIGSLRSLPIGQFMSTALIFNVRKKSYLPSQPLSSFDPSCRYTCATWQNMWLYLQGRLSSAFGKQVCGFLHEGICRPREVAPEGGPERRLRQKTLTQNCTATRIDGIPTSQIATALSSNPCKQITKRWICTPTTGP